MNLFNFENVDGVGTTPEGVHYLVASGDESNVGEVFLYPRTFAVGILAAETSEAKMPVLTLNLEGIAHPCYSCMEVHNYEESIVIALVPEVARAMASIIQSVMPEFEEVLEEFEDGSS